MSATEGSTARTRSTTHDLVVVEDVWGAPFDDLDTDLSIARRPDAWRDPAELGSLVGSTRALAVRNRTRVTEEMLVAAPHLRVVLRAGVGLDNIDVAAADRLGVVVVAPLAANARSVAEHTIGLALALARDIVVHDAAVRAGRWDRTTGQELGGRTWGVIGAGATGRAVAALAGALGMRVLAFDPYADDSDGLEHAALDTVVGSADVLSVHVPATEQTTGLVDADLLSRMRPGALLINVGRGEVVDETALAAALHDGRLGGAALDVRSSEPPAPGPLDDAPRTVFTPHVAGITAQSQLRIAEVLTSNLRELLAGGTACDAVGAVDRIGPTA